MLAFIARQLLRVGVKLAGIAERRKAKQQPAQAQQPQAYFIPYQPLQGVVEKSTDSEGECWRYRFFNATQGNTPHYYISYSDPVEAVESAECFKAMGGIQYTITGLPQRDE